MAVVFVEVETLKNNWLDLCKSNTDYMGVDGMEVIGDKEHLQVLSEETARKFGNIDNITFDDTILPRRRGSQPDEKREYLCFKAKDFEYIKGLIQNSRPNPIHKGKWILEITKNTCSFAPDW